MFYNANRDTSKDPNGMIWWDVFPQWKPEEAEQTEEEMFEMMLGFTKSREGLVS